MREFAVEQDGIRLDKMISNIYEDLSRTMIQKLIEEKKVIVNGKPQKPSYKVNIGDKIQIEEIEVQEIQLKPQNIPLELVY